MDVEQYLQQEGLKSFKDPKRYWGWAKSRLGTKSVQQFMDMMSHRATGMDIGSSELYDFLATSRHATVAASFEYELLLKILGWVEPLLPHEGTIVELGCHTGLLSRFYAMTRPQCQVIGLDMSSPAIQAAKSQAEANGINNLTFTVADLCNLDTFTEIQAECIVSGRVFSELMTPVRRRQTSWQRFDYPERDQELDVQARHALDRCVDMLRPGGKLLVTERLADYDRLNRLWALVQEAGLTTGVGTITPIEWSDIAGDHQTWFFEATTNKEQVPFHSPVALDFTEIPLISREGELVNNETRIMLKGILAWKIRQSLKISSHLDEGLLQWPSEDVIHYELGITEERLGFAYIASNTGLNLLTLFLSFEMERVQRDLYEYLDQLRSSGAKLDNGLEQAVQ